MSVNTAPAATRRAVHPVPARLALVADDPFSRRLKESLRHIGLDPVIEAKSIAALGSAGSPPDLDVILVAPPASRDKCLKAFRDASSRFPTTTIVGVWPDSRRIEARVAIKTGIDGLISEGQIETALGPILQAVSAGLVCFPRRIPASSRAETLSNREKQVLAMLIMGFTNAEIGQRLFLAESTVKSHVSSAYMKLGVRSRKDAAALILDPNGGLGTGILAISGD